MEAVITKRRKSKSPSGDGHISQDARGYWNIRLTKGYDANGKQLFKYFTAKTKTKLLRKRDEYKEQQRKGLYVEDRQMTLSEWLDYWYENHVVDKVKIKTRCDYECSIRCHLKPKLGRMKLIDLKAMHVQHFYNELFKNGRVDGKGGLSAKSIRNIHVALHSALEQAVNNDLIIKNPLRGVTLPRQDKKEREALTTEEQKKLVAECFNHPWGTAIFLTLYTGMRLGEVLGLTWKDIDFEKNSISINKQVGRIKNFDPEAKKKTTLSLRNETKTSSSNRKIIVPPMIMEKLAEHKKAQDKHRKRLGKIYNDLNMVFCRENGKIADPKTFSSFFLDTLKKAGLEHKTFHALRHTFTTRAMEANARIEAVSKILGHSNTSITMDVYSHVSSDLQLETMQKIVDCFL